MMRRVERERIWREGFEAARHFKAPCPYLENCRHAQIWRRNASTAARQARDAAEEANRQKDFFVGVVSHELRMPLRAILGWTQALQKQPSPNAARQGIQAVERNARTLARLVDDWLDVTRMAANRLDLHMRDADFADIVEAAVQTVQPAAGERPPNPSPLSARLDGRQ